MVLVVDGIITKIGESLIENGSRQIDAEGMMISVGWLDAHCHYARQGDSISIDLVEDVLRQGVTYAVDMGTLGPADYPENRAGFRGVSDVSTSAYLNISTQGVGVKPKDFEGPADIDPALIEDVVARYRSELLGLKARIDDKFCFDPAYVMNTLRMLGDKLDMPIAVHAPRSLIGIDILLSYLKKGDVLCHTLAGNSKVMDVVDYDGVIRRSVRKAQERGVIFDLSHGTNAYSYDAAEAAWKAGFFTDTISSDLHARNLGGPVYSLGNVLTKVRGLTGMEWWQILNKTIVQPVRLQHISDKATEIHTGMKADLTIFKITHECVTLFDSRKEERVFKEQIVPIYTCVGRNVHVCR